MFCRYFKLLLIFTIFISCGNSASKYTYTYLPPNYDSISIIPTSDTLKIALDENTNADLKVYNTFLQDNKLLLSFYDVINSSINIYDFSKNEIIKRISTKKLVDIEIKKKNYPYVINFDSIFVLNYSALYMIDSSGDIKLTIPMIREKIVTESITDPTVPLILKNNHVYSCIDNTVTDYSLKAMKKWKIIYDFDLVKKTCLLKMEYPDMFRNNLYGYHFIDYGLCTNDKGNLVFSFAGDTSIYESDLENTYNSYYAKSHYQKKDIVPLPVDSIKDSQANWRCYLKSDSYGPIYFDPATKRYLRTAKTSLLTATDNPMLPKRQQHIIILNEQKKIIGESDLPHGISTKGIFITPAGNIYGKLNSKSEDTAYFIRLAYANTQELKLAKKIVP